MTDLLDLPGEILLMILDYVLLKHDNEAEAAVRNGPTTFQDWTGQYINAHENPMSQRTTDIYRLMRSCHRLNKLLKRTFYRDIVVRRGWLGPQPRELLKRTLEDDRGLEKYIVSASVPCDDSIADLTPFFWLPNIHTLTIAKFNDWEPLEDPPEAGTSPVRVLRLLDCGAHEEALAAVLSWPANLEELHYDAEQGEWAGHYQGHPAQEWTCEAFVRTLQAQKESLKTLTLTRPPLVHEGLGYGPRIDLGDFSLLTTLRIYHVFLCGWDDEREAWKALPKSLEELEVYYDDADVIKFLETEETFLVNLIRHKEEHYPRLRKVMVSTPELRWDEEIEEKMEPGPWPPPEFLVRECEQAKVELSVWFVPEPQ
jgi:hypothetical protein